jgi:hypothetical protein
MEVFKFKIGLFFLALGKKEGLSKKVELPFYFE